MTDAPRELEDQLDSFLDEAEMPADYYFVPPDELELLAADDPVREPWRIATDSAADWALRKLVKVAVAAGEIDELATDRILDIQRWRDARLAQPLADINHWRGLLEDYALRRRAETGAKSVSLPNGTLETRSTKAAVEIGDKGELLRWLGEHEDLLAEWCKSDPEPQVSRIKPSVAISKGSLCKFCHYPIVPEKRDGIAPLWMSTDGAHCTVAAEAPPHATFEHDNDDHWPSFAEDGEMIEVLVVTVTPEGQWTRPVPGLSVRAESINPVVKPAI